MMHTRRQFMHHIGCASALGALSPLAAWAQTIDQLKIFYGFPAGSAGDSVARRVGEKLAASPYTRNPAVVENKPGAGGRIAQESLKGAPADGTVLTLSPFSCTSIYPHIYSRPFNPPHMIPLVEVGGGERTAPQAVADAMAFYAHIGKRPILVRREIKGHIANRLQAALWREAFHLVDQGVATVEDIDTAISQGPGLRWALMGPFMNLHLSGGDGGIAHLLAHLGDPIESWWQDLGAPSMTEALQRQVTEGVAQALGDRQASDLAHARDALLIELLRAKQASGLLGQPDPDLDA